jgi:hypothetical protein
MKKNLRKNAYFLLLELPPALTLIIMLIITFTNQTPIIAEQGLMLSPVKSSSPLLFVLALFFIGYHVMIAVLFKDLIIKLITKKLKKS